jgi:hypothetical protein
VKEYPQAGHPFLNDHHDVMFKVLKIVGSAIHEPSVREARRREPLSSTCTCHRDTCQACTNLWSRSLLVIT